MQRASHSSAAAAVVARSPSSARPPAFFRAVRREVTSPTENPMWFDAPRRRRASPPPAHRRRAPPSAAAAAASYNDPIAEFAGDEADRYLLSFDAEPTMPRRNRRRAAVRAEAAIMASPAAAASSASSRKRKPTPPVAAADESSAKKPAARLKTDPSDPPEDTNCCICMTEPEAKDLASIDGCDHQFCFGCIEKWADRENKCPLCKERFHKIERVMKPTKRSKGGPKSSKKVKNRDQRTDTQIALGHLFGTFERGLLCELLLLIGHATLTCLLIFLLFLCYSAEDLLSSRGSLPHGHLARLLFSSVGAGPPPVFAALAAASSTRRTSQPARSRRAVPPTRMPPPPLSAFTDSDDEEEFAVAAAARASRASAAATSARIRMRLESHNSLFTADDSDSDNDSDSSGFGSFVRHMNRRGSGGGISSMRFFEFGTAVRSPPAPAPRSYATNSADRTAGRTADNALEIEDSDDDVEVVNLD
jgi:hypothetical protein